MADDEQDYVQERLEEVLAAAKQSGRHEAERQSQNALATVMQHVPKWGKLVAASDPQRCQECGEVFPCPVLKAHARPWRHRDGFPRRLL
jgi:hypothetical protein